MSLRQFYPKRNSRKGLSTWKLFVVYGILLVAIALQISYPLTDGETLRIITIATVYWAAGAMLFHALLAYGLTYTLIFFLVTFSYSLIIEQIGSRTGWPFGSYEYSGTLGYQIYGVPLVVPFAWVMIAHPILI
ncbi:MAG: carotenoid biosynthesis protein, partial [Actinobacteria bacterium]|nr:carotenoid biosynthesis protein [Actinomycetota bacterium]